MKSFFTLCFILVAHTAFSASVTVLPFSMVLDLQKDYELTAQMSLACRYEKLVFGDSAEYETFYKEADILKVSYNDLGNGFNQVVIRNPEKIKFTYNHPLIYGEECRASFKVNFTSLRYAKGHGLKPKEPVSFQLWKGFYDYQEGNQTYDLNKMRKYLDKTEYSFSEQKTANALIIRILQDGREAHTSPWVERAILNPQTGLPHSPN